MASCIFCDVLAGRADGSFVHRDEHCAAFLDIRPVNPGHVLVVPLEHADSLGGIAPQTAGHMMRIAQATGAALRDCPAVRCEGVNLHLADGRVAGQDVFHAHLHVIPRFAGDGFGLRFPPGYGGASERLALDRLAEELGACVDAGETSP